MRKLLLSVLFLSLLGGAGSVSAGWQNIPGTACHPYANGLADLLQRNHIRLQNPINSGRSMWVLCPIQRDDSDMSSSVSHPYGYINIYRQGGGGFDDTYTECYVRQFDYDTTAVPGQSTSGQLWSTLINVPSIPANQASDTYYDMSTTMHSDNNHTYYSMMCLLKPGMGINSIDVNFR